MITTFTIWANASHNQEESYEAYKLGLITFEEHLENSELRKLAWDAHRLNSL